MTYDIDPVSRYVHVHYTVPDDAPDKVDILCTWSPAGAESWRPAKVTPFVSETAMALVSDVERNRWTREGTVTERNAAGLVRTVVFRPYPDAEVDGKVDVDFRVQIQTAEGVALAAGQVRVLADNSDVVYIEDWTGVFQKDAVSTDGEPEGAQWAWRPGLDEAERFSSNNMLHGNAGRDTPLPQLSYPLDRRGPHALFVSGAGGLELRLTGDERADNIGVGAGEEVLWRWTRMDRQHLVLKQHHEYAGWAPAQIDYVKLVPLSAEHYHALEAPFSGKRDKFVAGYWEPYSWAFHENVQDTWQHRAVLSAFRDARFSLVDSQVNRFGAKPVFETRVADQLLYETEGDRRQDDTIPVTRGVGQMQQYTNALDATIRYTRELGLACHANFGASASYVGTPLQGEFSKQHSDWLRGSQLRFEVPEVRAYALGLVREALEIGAPGISIDFMRYSFTIPDIETCNTFLRELRALADEFAEKRGEPVPILVQFPGKGVLPPREFKTGSWDLFDYRTWVREGWVDYICPSNDDERHLHLDVAAYLDAVEETNCKVLPNVTAAGLTRPGLYLWRVNQLYSAGVDGIYIYQSDQCVLGRPVDRRCARLLASSEDVRRWWAEDTRLRPRRSKGIYITRPSRPPRGWRPRERVRVWLEGIEMGQVELYLDGRLVNRYDGPTYLLGTEDRDSDQVIPRESEVELLVRAKDGDGWLEQTFHLQGEQKRS